MEPFPFKTIEPERVALINGVVGTRRGAYFDLASKRHRFRFSFRKLSFEPKIHLRLKISDYEISLTLDRVPLLADFSEQFQGVRIENINAELVPALYEHAFTDLLKEIESRLGVRIEVLSASTDTASIPQEAEALDFTVETEDEGVLKRGTLHMSHAALEFMGALIGGRSEVLTGARFQSVEVPVKVIIGDMVLTLKEFKNLAVKDILLLNGSSYQDTGACRVIVANRVMFSATVSDGTVTLGELMEERNEPEKAMENMDITEGPDVETSDEELEPQSHDQSSEQEPDADEPSEFHEAQDDAPVAAEVPEEPFEDSVSDGRYDDLPIQIAFEVGRKRMSIGDLNSVRSGFTFELENAVNEAVTIRANGRVVGKGELIKIGERVGVRVISFKENA